MLPSTVERVPQHTTQAANEEIRRQTDENIRHYTRQGRSAIENRLQALDDEWDIERTLEANAATVSLLGIALGTMVDRRFFCYQLQWQFSYYNTRCRVGVRR